MKKLIIVMAALTASVGFAQAPASDTAASTAAPESAPAAQDPNEKICRNVESTSTRLGRKRECKTRAEWAAQFRQAGDNAARAQARSQ